MKDEPEGGFPVYILDDDTIVYTERGIDHSKYWTQTVSKIVAEKHGITKKKLNNLPYCQKRARVVGGILYCGEKISKKLHTKISKALKRKLRVVYDEHETRCSFEVAEFKALKSPYQ